MRDAEEKVFLLKSRPGERRHSPEDPRLDIEHHITSHELAVAVTVAAAVAVASLGRRDRQSKRQRLSKPQRQAICMSESQR